MVATVIEVNCEPTGLVLEQVHAQPMSSALTAASGGFRHDDVGKLISIPGAADLVATTVRLIDAKEIALTDVTDNGGANFTRLVAHPDLTGPDPEPDFGRGDEGKRIMITGAGAGGADLLTFVKQFVDETTLILQDPAEQPVSGRRMVLNVRDRIGLDDYARGDAIDQTITLPDGRQVTDAHIVKGHDVLRSETANFSVNDLGHTVTLEAAGRHTTTIVAVDDRTSVQLQAPVQRAVEDGQADVWDESADCRPVFRDLLVALRDDAGSVEAADIVFGPGVFDFTHDPQPHPRIPGSLELVGVRNVTLRGAGPGATVLRLRPDQELTPDAHVIRLTACDNVVIRDLTVHGAYLTMGKVNEQMHGIFISAGCRDIIVERVDVFQTAGDGIRFLGLRDQQASPPIDQPVRRVWIDKCRLIQNKRTGIAVQRNSHHVWVRDCYIEMTPPSTASCIDFEPSGNPNHGDESPSDFVFDSNVLVATTNAVAVSISGFSPGRPARRVRFVNNTLSGGTVGGVDAEDVTIAGNTVDAGPRRVPVLRFRGRYDGLRIENNRISTTVDGAEGILVSGMVEEGAGSETTLINPSRVRISGNDIDVRGIGISLENVGSFVEVEDNRIFGHQAARGIVLVVRNSASGVHHGVRISGNLIVDFGERAIDIARGGSNETVPGLQVVGNRIVVTSDAADGLQGIALRSDHGDVEWAAPLTIAGNTISHQIPIKISTGKGASIWAIAGNPSGVAVFEGDGTLGATPPADHTPEGHVVGAPGSVFLENSTQPATLFYKQDGVAEFGWKQIDLLP